MTVITIIGFVITIISIYFVGYLNRVRPDYVFSFKDTIGIHRVPIVSFEHNGKTMNFIIDSGATNSIINYSALKEFDYKLIENASGNVYGIDGNRIDTQLAKIELTKQGHVFKEIFQVLDVPGLDNMKDKEGIQVHGLLGTTFLRKYQFIIDYKTLRAYISGKHN